jgi:hypothetical protein
MSKLGASVLATGAWVITVVVSAMVLVTLSLCLSHVVGDRQRPFIAVAACVAGLVLAPLSGFWCALPALQLQRPAPAGWSALVAGFNVLALPAAITSIGFCAHQLVLALLAGLFSVVFAFWGTLALFNRSS